MNIKKTIIKVGLTFLAAGILGHLVGTGLANATVKTRTLKQNRAEYKTIGDTIAECLKNKNCSDSKIDALYKRARELNLERVKLEK